MARLVTGRDEDNNVRLTDDSELSMQEGMLPATPQDMRADIHAGLQMRSEFDDIWKLCYDAYRDNMITTRTDMPVLHDEGGGWEFSDTPDQRTHIAIIKSVVDSVVASLATRTPEFAATAERPEFEPAAELGSLAASRWWHLYEGNPAWRESTFDASVAGHGWIKTTWLLDEETEPISDDEIEARVQTALSETASTAILDPDSRPPDERELRRQIESEARENPHTLVFIEHPVIHRISPFDMVIDPEATSFREAAWVAQRYWEPLSDVFENDEYDETARMQVTASGRYSWMDITDEGQNTSADDRYSAGVASLGGSSSAKRAMLWEYHDIRNGTWCVFANDGSDYLIAPRKSPFFNTPFKTPFSMVPRYQVSGDLYPIGDVEPLLGLQVELDDTRTQQMLARRQLAMKYALHRDVLSDDANRAALKSNRPGEVVVLDANRPLSDAIMALPPPNLPSDFYAMTDVIHQDVERVSGVTEMMRGLSSVSRRTATEANLLGDAVTARMGQQLEMHQEIAASIGQRMIVLAQKYMSAEAFVPLVGDDVAQAWTGFTAEDIAGQFHFTVTYGSMMPRDDNAMQQKAVQVMQLLAPLVGTAINPFALARYVLKAFDVPRMEEMLLSPEQQEGYAEEQAMLAEAQAAGRGGPGSSQPGGGPAAPPNPPGTPQLPSGDMASAMLSGGPQTQPGG